MNRAHSLTCLVLLAIVSPVRAQEAASPFAAPMIVFDDLKRIVCTADLDGDGDRDALGFWGVTSALTKVHAFGNDGRGVFALAWQFDDSATAAERATWSMAAGNFDGDAREDFVLRLGSRFTVYSSNGLAAPSVLATWIEPAAIGGGGLVVADFDRDGRDDFAAHLGSSMKIYRSGQLGFTVTATEPVPTGELAGADLDGDGDADLCVLTASDLRVFFQGGATLTAGPSFAHGLAHGTDPVMCVPGDVDGDGDDDVVLFGSWGEYRILRQTGPAQFSLEVARTGGPATGLADLDGDGDLDGTCCSSGGGGPPTLYNNVPSNFELSLNRGGGDFAPAWVLPSLGAARLAAAEDLDGDGDVDLLAGRVTWFNHGNTFARDPRPPHGVWWGLERPVMHDADGDGDIDASINVQGATFARFVNDGTGTLAPSTVPLPPPPAGHTWLGPGWHGDFDGDGDDDLVVHLLDGSGAFVRVELLRNPGNGQLVDAGPAAAPGQAFTWYTTSAIGWRDYIADLDGDGDADVATYYGFIAWNDGGGFFTPGTSFSGGRPVGSADFDNDGHPDLVLARNARIEISYGRVGVFGGFGDRQWWGAGGENDDASVVARDFDGDGDVDLIYSFGALALLENHGGRNYTPRLLDDRVSYAGAEFVFASDFDGDGLTDLLAGPAQHTTTLFLKGRGNLQFDTGVQQIAGNAQGVADVDGDGDLDFLTGGLVRNATHDDLVAGCRQFGSSGLGAGGFRPVLGSSGAPRVGATVTTHLRGGVGGSAGVWVWSLSTANLPGLPLPGLHLYASPILVALTTGLSGASGIPGAGGADLSYTVQPHSAGFQLVQQFFLFDTTAPASFVHTNGLEIRYGR